MPVYGYCRVSTMTQVEGYGLDLQKEKLNAAFKIDRFFIDAGITGMAESRPALDEMLSILQDGDIVAVLNVSRLWRGILVQAFLTREIMKTGAIIKSIEEPQLDIYAAENDPNAFLIQSILGTLAEWERRQIIKRLASARNTKARQGVKPCGSLPMGYKYSNDKKTVEICEDEADIVKQLFQKYAHGASLADLVDWLTAKGVKTRSGKPWQRGTVSQMLKNKFYIGYLQHANTIHQGTHPVIISKNLFNKAQKRGRA